jgi:hypothetical protein
MKSCGMPARLREEMMLDVLKGAQSLASRSETGSHVGCSILRTGFSGVRRLTAFQARPACKGQPHLQSFGAEREAIPASRRCCQSVVHCCGTGASVAVAAPWQA